MLLKIYPENPNDRAVKQVVECLNDGGVIIFPTDTIYAIGCSLQNHKAIDRVALIKGMKKDKATFSFIFDDLSQLSQYTKPIDNAIFRVMKSCLPGPFTFILEANNNIPKFLNIKKRTVGIRVPDNNIPRSIVKQSGIPLVSTSVHDDDDDIVGYITDPELIYEKYGNQVDIVIDGGFGDIEPSTVIGVKEDELTILRQGKGTIEL